jgi:peptidoglycan/xylan/chitin deacetylase (PgdA/CDA1 family)
MKRAPMLALAGAILVGAIAAPSSASSGIVYSSHIPGAIAAVSTTEKVVALTFDDGPDPRWTPMILQILHDEQVPATFCVVGHVASRHPELVVAEHDGGYALCDHTVHHIIHLDLRPHSQIVDEIDQAADFIRSVAGTDATYFRAPGGYVSDDVIAVAHQRGLRVLGWTVDPHDYQRPSVDLLLRRVLNTVRPGAIVLLHDGGGDRSHTVAALKPLIEFLKAAGYSFTTP